MIKPKNKRAGIMVSNFIDKHSGFLAIMDDKYEVAKQSNMYVYEF